MEYFVSAKIYKKGEINVARSTFDGIIVTDLSQNIIDIKKEIVFKKDGDEALINTIRKYILFMCNYDENHMAHIIAFNNIK